MAKHTRVRHEEEDDYGDDDRPRTTDGKVRLRSLDELDGRTAAARYARDVVAGLESDLGTDDPSTAQRQLCRRAALAGALAEDFEARWLEGAKIDVAAWASVARLQMLVLQALGLERRAKNITPAVNGATRKLVEALRNGA